MLRRTLAIAIKELLQLRRDLPGPDRPRGIAEVTLDDGAQVEAHELALAKLPLRRRDSVDHLVVHGNADRLRIAPVPEERRLSAASPDARRGDPVDVLGGRSGTDGLHALGQDLLDDARRPLHQEHLRPGLAGDHRWDALLAAAAMSAATVSTGRFPSIVTRTPAFS